MKKAVLFILLAVGVILIGALIYSFLPSVTITGKTIAPVNSYLQDQGTLQLLFCPGDDCEQALVDFLSSANSSLHCAFYDIGLKSVQETLLEKSRKIDVKVVTDDDYLKKFNHPFVKADKWGLMHNKFCLVDGQAVSAGSMNPTDNDAHKNNNNLLLIHSRLVAQNYEDEFQEMWNGKFKGGEEVKNPQIRVGTIPLEIYFCPEDHCAEHVKEELKKATTSIYFLTFSFTHDGIANILLLKHLDNVTIRGIMETRQISEYSKFNVLQYQIGDDHIFKDTNPRNLHHKVFIIDEETVLTGSFNPTAGGNERNDENLLIIRDKGIATRFVEEFRGLYPGKVSG